jgi:hypothetical protein
LHGGNGPLGQNWRLYPTQSTKRSRARGSYQQFQVSIIELESGCEAMAQPSATMRPRPASLRTAFDALIALAASAAHPARLKSNPAPVLQGRHISAPVRPS